METTKGQDMGTTAQVAALPKCDLCGNADAQFDGKTVFGPWAYMCNECWTANGVGKLGTGYGQKLEVTK